MRKVKAAVIGTGFIGKAHVEAIRRMGHVELAAIVLDGQEKADAAAASLHVPKAYGNYRDLLHDSEIEVIHNCTPNHMHFEINKQALLHGKHVLSEKPLTRTYEESQELYLLAREKGLVTGVNFNYRQFPMIQHLRAMVQDNDLGDIRLVRGSYLQDWLFYDTDYNWRIEPEYGGKTRAIGDIGSHVFDLAQYVTGMRIVEVFADTVTAIPKRYKPLHQWSTFHSGSKEETELVDIHTEDYGSVLVKFENGGRGVFTVSQISAGKKNALELHIDGSKASVSWRQEEPNHLDVGFRDKPAETVRRDPGCVKAAALPYLHYPGGHEEGWPESLKNMMLHFYDQVLGMDNRSQSVASFEEGHNIMLIEEAIVKSAETGSWQKIEALY
ncbi:Gfo/Idh/MocA family protein [Paenibacillus abyssi]|uniref:Dehydrogenase n=1 Tax=Paenibacillus abyssi TaxID=1340531 RepID=A0A917FTW2_9BACL|nr:Gfo/Idh/MocA family oxidoreductase [Paenibacillus abyssi]GGG01228.1 dehydrogenase [Paenibacillus abyssi]